MKDTLIGAQYSTGLSRRNIERALVSAPKDLDHLQPSDLALIEDFYTENSADIIERAPTDWARITPVRRSAPDRPRPRRTRRRAVGLGRQLVHRLAGPKEYPWR